ncbi:MAG: disulfide oxidoreductase [Sulfurospirillaceae bacterium]|nr:disulfide oxidoreductase [Sulfurospirillaceae bacterium]MDD3463359.1 disulfide oxidoreductase [Sulfurospirillaceae bacterium]
MQKKEKTDLLSWYLLFASWIVATIAMLGSLFFSEIMLFPPCVMCWYQRICMYPLVVIFLVALISPDRSVIKYSFPLVFLGIFLAGYQNLLHYGIIPESAQPCTQGVSCTSIYINWFGFLTIPMLSLIAFTIIAIFLTILKRRF